MEQAFKNKLSVEYARLRAGDRQEPLVELPSEADWLADARLVAAAYRGDYPAFPTRRAYYGTIKGRCEIEVSIGARVVYGQLAYGSNQIDPPWWARTQGMPSINFENPIQVAPHHWLGAFCELLAAGLLTIELNERGRPVGFIKRSGVEWL